MATTATVRLIGADFLKAELKRFPAKIQAQAIDKGIRKGASILATQMRREAYSGPPKDPARPFTRTLRKALRASVGKKNGPHAGKAWVGLKRIRGESKARNYYRVLEFGRRGYSRRGGGGLMGRALRAVRRAGGGVGAKYRGTPNPMRPFFRRAWDAKKAEVGQAIINATLAALAREAGKAYAASKSSKR